MAYDVEVLDEDIDDGTMPDSLERLSDEVVGHRIVKVDNLSSDGWYSEAGITITLDNGKRVKVRGSGDCCAYTGIEAFFLNPEAVDHIITGIGTTDQYSTWHIYADMGDVLKLDVGWSGGNVGYYGYGFKIVVEDI